MIFGTLEETRMPERCQGLIGVIVVLPSATLQARQLRGCIESQGADSLVRIEQRAMDRLKVIQHSHPFLL
jgi:hypothetical protein